jgi:hypothetical protein
MTSRRYTTRALLPATARLWQELLADYMVPGTTSLILDLGFSELLARRFGGHVIGSLGDFEELHAGDLVDGQHGRGES